MPSKEWKDLTYEGKKLVIVVKGNNQEEIVIESDIETNSENEKSQEEKEERLHGLWTCYANLKM